MQDLGPDLLQDLNPDIVPPVEADTPASRLDWDATVDNLCLDITSNTCVLQPGGSEYLHLRWTVRDALTGAAIILTDNESVVALEMAVAEGEPASSDWLAAKLVTREASSPGDGEYSVIKIGAGTGAALTAGKFLGYGRLTTTGEVIERLAPSALIVQGA